MGLPTIATAAIAAQVIGTGVQAVGVAQQARAAGYQEDAIGFQRAAIEQDAAAAAIDRQTIELEGEAERARTEAIATAHLTNARFREYQARRTMELAEAEEAEVRLQVEGTLGQQVADLAAAGRDPTMATPLAVAAASARAGEREALKVRTAGMLESEALTVEAALDRLSADDALTGGAFAQQATELRSRAVSLRSEANRLRGEAGVLSAEGEAAGARARVFSSAGRLASNFGASLLTSSSRIQALR